MIVGSVIGTIRTTQNPWLVHFGNAWVELFRNIPLLVQMFLWYFVIPEFIPPLKPGWSTPSRRTRSSCPPCSASGCSRRRASPSRCAPAFNRCRAANATPAWRSASRTPQVYRYVLLPMAFRIVIPPLTSETMNLIKNSSIALTIGLAELTFRSREIGEYTFRFFEAFTAATVIYIVMAMTANRVMALVERRVSVPGFIAGGEVRTRCMQPGLRRHLVRCPTCGGHPVHAAAHRDVGHRRPVLRDAARAGAAVAA